MSNKKTHLRSLSASIQSSADDHIDSDSLASASSSEAASSLTSPSVPLKKKNKIKTKVSKGKLLRLGSSMGLAIPLTLTRRAWRGAAYKTWSLGFEVQYEMGQALLRNHHRFTLADLRQLSADFAPAPPTDGSASVRTVSCGGVRASVVRYLARASSSKKDQRRKKNNKKQQQRLKLSKSEPVHKSGCGGLPQGRWDSIDPSDERPHASILLSKSTTSSPIRVGLLAQQSPWAASSSSSSSSTSIRRMKSNSIDKHTTLPGHIENKLDIGQNENEGEVEEDEHHHDDDENNDDAPATVLYLHGGGFCVGSATTYRRCLWHFSREMKGLRFLAVNYSLSPQVRFPTALRECLHAYLWLIDENGGNVRPERVVLAGDSAGGCLVLAVLFLIRHMRESAAETTHLDDNHDEQDVGDHEEDDDRERETTYRRETRPFPLPSRKTPPSFPLCAFLMSPWVDLSDASSVMKPESYPTGGLCQMSLARRFINAYLRGSDNYKSNGDDQNDKNMEEVNVRSPFISPLYGDLRGLPPVMITAGGEEPLLGDIQALHAKCLAAGIETELDVGLHMGHAYQVFHTPNAHGEIERSIRAVGDFIWRHLSSSFIRNSS